MTTAYKSLQATTAAFMQAFGNYVSADDTVQVGSALGVGDTLDLVRVAGGTRLHTIALQNDDFDTGTTLLIKIGYRSVSGSLATNDSAFGTGFTFLQAATSTTGRVALAITPIDFNEDVIIFATVTAAAAGVSAGTKSITTFANGIARGIK